MFNHFFIGFDICFNMIKNILKGFIIGIGKIIPGVSGSMLAISMGVYERALRIISRIREIKWSDFVFIISLVIGVFIGISMFSKGVKWFLDNYYFSTMLLFVGLIISGLPELVKECNIRQTNWSVKLKYLLVFIFAFTFSYLITKLGAGSFDVGSPKVSDGEISMSFYNVCIFFVIGLIEAFSSIVPGISGTAIFMSLGCYELLLSFYENILNPVYWGFGLVFFIGVIVGIVILAKSITYLLLHHKKITYCAIIGFMFSSILLMFLMVFDSKAVFENLSRDYFLIFKSVLFVFVGYYLGIKINKILAND